MNVRPLFLWFFVLSTGTACAGPGGTSSQLSPIPTGVTLQPTNTPTLATSAPTAAPTATLSSTSVPTLASSPTPAIVAAVPTATAAPSGITCQQDPNARITRLVVSKPTTRTIADFQTLHTLAGNVYIYATANRANFSYWKVEYSGDDRKTWAPVALRGLVATPVVDQQILAWNTDSIPDGEYWLRILVVDKAGNYNPPCELRFLVKNTPQITGTTGACTDPNAVITSVKNDQVVSRRLLIAGSANRDNFSYYELQFSSDQKNWTRLQRVIRPAVNENLFSWDTNTVSNGDYWLRLLVVDKTGNYNEPCPVHIVVRN